MQPRTFIAVGSSEADGLERVVRAVDRLNRQGDVNVIAVSPWYETTPVGSADSRFINGVIEVATNRQPLELLDVIQQIERELGRMPGDRWGPRAIDLDLLACGDLEYESGRLKLPHRATWYRRFVLDPWEQIAADWLVPHWRMTVADLRRRLLQRPLPVRLIGGRKSDRQEIADRCAEDFKGSLIVTSIPVEDAEPLKIAIGYLPESMSTDNDCWCVDISRLACDLNQTQAVAARFVLTAALDEPNVTSPE